MLRAAGFTHVAVTDGLASRFAAMRGRRFDKRAWCSRHVDAWR